MSIGRRSRATRSRRISCIRRASPRCGAGGCSTVAGHGLSRRSTRTRSTSGRSRSRERPAADAPSRTARGGPCSTSCSSTPPARPAPRSAKASRVEDHRLRRRSRHRDARPRQGRRRRVTEHARVVIGADGRHSLVAQAVEPEQYHEKPTAAGRLLHLLERPADGRPLRDLRPPAAAAWAAWPTHDDLTLVVAGWPYAEFEANKNDVEGNFLKMFDLAPAFAERMRGGTRETRFAGTAVPNFFRKPFGPGWALVGDAGYNKDFITAQGITDAFRDAELCATALDEAFTGARSFDAAMAEYQPRATTHVLPMFEFTCQLATLEPPPPEMQQLLGAMHGNQEAMDGFAQVNAGVTSPAEFFCPENVEKIMLAANAMA